MGGALKRALDSACGSLSKVLDVDEATALRLLFAGSLTTFAVTAMTTRCRASTDDVGAYEEADAPSCEMAAQLERTEDAWKPKPNVQLPNGKWVYHPDFDVDMDLMSESTSGFRERVWSHAHVLPNGLLKDTREEGLSSGAKGRSMEGDDSDFTDDDEGAVKFRCVAGLASESNAGLPGINDRRRGPPPIRRLPCVRPGGSP